MKKSYSRGGRKGKRKRKRGRKRLGGIPVEGRRGDGLRAPAARVYWLFFTQRTPRRKERKVVVRGHSVLLLREDRGEGAKGKKGLLYAR